MTLSLTIALYVVGLALIALGMAGLVLPVIPGSPVIFLGIVAVAGAEGFTRIGPGGLLVTGLLAAAIFVVDYTGGLIGARKFGASWWGLLGALLGLIAGLPFGLPGVALGPIIGAILLEFAQDRDFRRSSKVGLGTLAGFLLATAVKYALACCLLGVALLLWLV